MKGWMEMKKGLIFNKIIALILAIIMAVSLVPTAFAAETDELVILYTNDVHCAIDGYPFFAAYRAELMNSGKDVVTVDVGDAIQGEIIGTRSQGSAIIDIMNTVGYDYAVPGNHEFDYGMDAFLNLAENEANFNYIGSNFVDLRTDKTVFEPYYIEETSIGKVAFVGITTPESITKSTPAHFQDEVGNYIYGFSQDTLTNFYDKIQNSIDSAIADGAIAVVAIGHMGIDGVTNGWKSTDVIGNTYGIDVFIDAHSHEIIEEQIVKNKFNEDIILTSSGTKLEKFGQVTIDENGMVDAVHIETDTVDVNALSQNAQEKYNSVKAKVDTYNAEISYLYDKIGESEANLIVYDETGNWLVRREETNMGNFVADAYVAGVEGADVALVNAGGVRSEIKVGDVSRIALMEINPWNNDMCIIKATGQQIADALEFGARSYPENSGGFLQTSSSLTYEIHQWVESPVKVDNMGNFNGFEDGEPRRVRNIKINGNPIDLEKEYNVVGTVYLLTQGGDGFNMFSAESMTKVEDTDAELLVKYFTETLNGKITAEQYGNAEGDGRITVYEANPCKHMCHRNGFYKIIWSVVKFFQRLFKTNSVCECGIIH